MKQHRLAAAALSLLASVPVQSLAQTAKDLVGTWKNVSNMTQPKEGRAIPSFGERGTGMAIFSADGHFVIVNYNPDTPKFAANSRAKGTPEENRAATMGGLGLFGTYKLEGNTIKLKVEGSTYPNWSDTEQVRTLTKFTKDDITWTVASSLGGTSTLSWKRIK